MSEALMPRIFVFIPRPGTDRVEHLDSLIGEAASAAGRPMPAMSTRLSVSFDGSERGVSILSGPPDEMIEQVRAYRDAGTEHLALDFGEVDPDAVTQAIERFDREVVAAL
jgi:alkanesulfonate monooxygenase SsuD/methylene tetrahydromethanopterin reductase-like flavin-dependent oxidoreductase (luciferase family)